MKWKITFYSTKVEQETLDFPPGILANFLHILEAVRPRADDRRKGTRTKND